MENFQKRFSEYIKKEKLLDTDSCKNIVAGISGGADSVCLLLLLKETFKNSDVKIIAVHVNHNLREEAKDDEEFVKNLCGELGVELRIFSEDVKRLSKEEGLSLEEAGRKARYEDFKLVAESLWEKSKIPDANGALSEDNLHGSLPVKIAVAHHMNDNVETVIFNMLRGSNLSGLSGIKPKQNLAGIEVIRPLLFATRDEIEEYLREKGQAFVTDKTNKDTEITRNKIRHEIIPEMLTINQGAVAHIAKGAEAIGRAEKFLEEKTEELYVQAVEDKGDEVFINVDRLKSEEDFLSDRVIYEAIGKIEKSLKDITDTHVESVAALMSAESGKRVNLPCGVTAVKEGCFIVLKKRPAKKENFSMEILREEIERGCAFFLPSGKRISFEIINVTDSNRKEIIKKNEYTKAFDYDKITDSVFLGTRTGCEKIELQQGTKSLARFFIDQKIPRDRREDYLILRDKNEVIWVLGLRISEKYKITDTTGKALKVSITGGCNG